MPFIKIWVHAVWAVKAVRNYINQQEQHHSKKSFQEEYDEFMEKYEFETFKG